MSHVDEGALHAYLDGALDEYPAVEAERIRAHLDGCAECAERLEVERRIHSDAHAMLGLAAPEVDVPSFEELRAYVDRTHRQRPGMTRLHRLGWAASVVLAIGAGWMLREGQLQNGALDMGRDRLLAPAEPVAEGGGAVVADEASADVGRRADRADAEGERASVAQPTGPGSRPEGGVPVEGLAERAGLPSSTVAKTDAADVERSAPDAATAAAEAEERMSAVPQPVAVDPDVSAGAAPPASAVVADELVAGRDPLAEIVASATDSAVPTLPLPAPSDVADATAARPDLGRLADSAAGAVTEPEERSAARRRAAPVPVTSALSVQAAPTTFEARESDDDLPTEPLLSVPGFEVLEVINLGDGSTLWGARVVQRRPDDVEFEVIHLEPGIDPSILSAAEAGHGEARAETESGWVLVRGPLAAEELEELLQRLFPGTS